jgi:hypothetical protein
MCLPSSTPDIPEVKPIAAPNRVDDAVMEARNEARKEKRRAGGRQGTLLTGGSGLSTQATTAKKTLLGQ